MKASVRSFFYFIGLLLVLGACKNNRPPSSVAAVSTAAVSTAAVSTAAASTAATPTPANHAVSSIQGTYLLKDSSSIRVFLHIQLDAAAPKTLSAYKLQWNLAADGGLRERIKAGKTELTPDNSTITGTQLTTWVEITRPTDYDRGIFQIELVEVAAGKKYVSDLPIHFKSQRFGNRFGLYVGNQNFPSSQTFVKVGEPIHYQAINTTNSQFYVLQLAHTFGPARSPMSTRQRPELPTTHWKQATAIAAGSSFTLPETGVYLVVEDTTMLSMASAILAVDNRFPRLTTPKQLIEPLTYISTNSEAVLLRDNEQAKQAFDQFMLTLTQANVPDAQALVRAYFRRVTEANELFTSYKEGWKTDRGMVYVVLGEPTKVQRLRDREVWQYAQSGKLAEVIFTFYRKSNQLSDDTFELVRYADYSQYWYPYVEAWRNGTMAE